MQAESNLLRMQRRFMAALMEPIFGASRGRSSLPAREGDVSADFVNTAYGLMTPSARLSPVDRLELYHRQYWYRLLDSLGEDFPALRLFLGDERFWRLMEAYLEANPPSCFTLRRLGAGLADFVEQRPDVVLDPVLAQDLARIEYALCHAFEAGRKPPLAPTELAESNLGLQPYITLLALRTPADELWRFARHGGRRPEPGRPCADRFVAVFRHGLDLHVERLPRAAFFVLEAISDLGTLEAAMDRVVLEQGLLLDKDARRVSEWFGTWTARGWFIERVESKPYGRKP